MTKFRADPEQLHVIATDVQGRADDIGGNQAPEMGDGNWPDQRAVRDFNGSVAGTNRGFQGRMSENSGLIANHAKDVSNTEASNNQALKAIDKDMALTGSGLGKDIMTGISGAVGPAASSAATVASTAVTATTTALNAGIQGVNTTLQAVTSAAKAEGGHPVGLTGTPNADMYPTTRTDQKQEGEHAHAQVN